MHVRAIQREDLAGVSAVLRTFGWAPMTQETWDRVWVNNPMIAPDQPPLDCGWVVEDGADLSRSRAPREELLGPSSLLRSGKETVTLEVAGLS